MLEEMIAYIELHEISVLQDADKFQDLMDSFDGDYDSDEYRDLEIDDYHNTGELMATRHLLSVARGILAKTNERK